MLAGAAYRVTAWAANAGNAVRPHESVSEPRLWRTSSTKSVAASSASRVMSQAALQISARVSESSQSPRLATAVASERSSRRTLAKREVAVVEEEQVGLGLADQLVDLGQLADDVDLDVLAAHQGGPDRTCWL